jgi:hypothetical protein
MLTVKGREFLDRHEEYSKHCEILEERLNHINNVRSILEKMCSNEIKVNNYNKPCVTVRGDLEKSHDTT